MCVLLCVRSQLRLQCECGCACKLMCGACVSESVIHMESERCIKCSVIMLKMRPEWAMSSKSPTIVDTSAGHFVLPPAMSLAHTHVKQLLPRVHGPQALNHTARQTSCECQCALTHNTTFIGKAQPPDHSPFFVVVHFTFRVAIHMGHTHMHVNTQAGQETLSGLTLVNTSARGAACLDGSAPGCACMQLHLCLQTLTRM